MNYRIKEPTLAVANREGQKTMVTVLAGSIIVVEDQQIGAMQMLEVEWNGRPLLMFAQDLKTRGEAVYQAA
jgi:hypothetical protein